MQNLVISPPRSPFVFEMANNSVARQTSALIPSTVPTLPLFFRRPPFVDTLWCSLELDTLRYGLYTGVRRQTRWKPLVFSSFITHQILKADPTSWRIGGKRAEQDQPLDTHVPFGVVVNDRFLRALSPPLVATITQNHTRSHTNTFSDGVAGWVVMGLLDNQ